MKPSPFHTRESGNVLFIILIAIALLAALTWSVTRSSRTQTTIAAEDAEIAAQNILSYANSVSDAVEHVMLANGCRDDQVSFENPVVAGYANPNAPADRHCHVFDPAGGGITWSVPDEKWLDASFSANAIYGQYAIPHSSCISDVGQGDASMGPCTDTFNDIFLALPFLKDGICTAINKKLNVNLPSGSAPVDGTNAWAPLTGKFTGTFGGTAVINLAGYQGRHTICFESSNTPPAGALNLYHVLIAH